VKVAGSFGLVCDVYPTETAAMKWLLDSPVPGDPQRNWFRNIGEPARRRFGLQWPFAAPQHSA
jgi:hypothetical protein